MTILIVDDLLSSKHCDDIINHGNVQDNWIKESSGQHISYDVLFAEQIVSKLETTINKSIPLGYEIQRDWFQLVKWNVGTGMNFHIDMGKPDTKFASILYLNSNYEGGETIFIDGSSVAPVKGRTLFFDGIKYKHGVSPVTNGTRYVIAVWYKLK